MDPYLRVPLSEVHQEMVHVGDAQRLRRLASCLKELAGTGIERKEISYE
jgi:hypothetical protein